MNRFAVRPGLALGLLLLFGTAGVWAADPVRLRLAEPPAAAAPGREVSLTLEVAVAPGFHLNAQKPSDPDLIPTRLELAPLAGVALKAARFPAPVGRRLAFLGQSDQFHDGTFLVTVTLQVAKDAAAGSRRGELVLSYQACDDQMCLMPAQQRVPFALTIPPRP